jgi:hypothetical protein
VIPFTRTALRSAMLAAFVAAALSTSTARHSSASARVTAAAEAQSSSSSGPSAATLAGQPAAPSKALAASESSARQAQPSQHTVTVKFDYDFTKMHACSANVTSKCIKQFNVYEVSGPTPIPLFSIPAPSGASSFVSGITGTSTQRAFFPGKHRIGVTAQVAQGAESNPYNCMTFANPNAVGRSASPAAAPAKPPQH